MIARKCTVQDLEKALKAVNKKYSDNIRWNRFPEHTGPSIRFTLRVKSSKEPGHRLGFPDYRTGKQNRMVSACWHVHGDFFDALFDIAPEAIIGTATQKITKDAGNWIDWDIGSMRNPMYHSEACECK